jgi:hypothetical protein
MDPARIEGWGGLFNDPALAGTAGPHRDT